MLTYIGDYTQVYIVTEKFLLDMYDIKLLNEIYPSSITETTDSDSGSVQGANSESKSKKDGTAMSFGAAMFGAVYKMTCEQPNIPYDPLMYSYNLKHKRTPLPWVP